MKRDNGLILQWYSGNTYIRFVFISKFSREACAKCLKEEGVYNSSKAEDADDDNADANAIDINKKKE